MQPHDRFHAGFLIQLLPLVRAADVPPRPSPSLIMYTYSTFFAGPARPRDGLEARPARQRARRRNEALAAGVPNEDVAGGSSPRLRALVVNSALESHV